MEDVLCEEENRQDVQRSSGLLKADGDDHRRKQLESSEDKGQDGTTHR